MLDASTSAPVKHGADLQQAFAAAEIKRLQEFKKVKEHEQERLEGYVSYVIQRLGKDAKGKWRKLEGNSSTMFLRACASSVEITCEADIQLDYKSAIVKMSAAMWLDVLNSLDNADLLLAYETELTVDKRAVKASIDAGVEVPGAKLITDKTSLGRR